MLSGAYTRKLDKNRRLYLPKSFLNQFEDNSLVITPSPGPYLILFHKNKWRMIEKSVADNSFSSNPRTTGRFMRYFISGAFEITVANHGRITLPKDLLLLNNFKNEVILLGLLNRIELWDPEVFNNFVFKEEEEIFLPKELLDADGPEAWRSLRQIRNSYRKLGEE